MNMLRQEAQRRRTFAIISHPDAGKTTLTEKLLLYSGAIHLAGSVKSRKASRHAVSDWMKMEQERGISITSSVLQFEHQGCALNLLDTPGHADFSEDTYRTLAAVDCAIMLLDHGKGIEERTYKLFEVCRRRSLPIITFINKLDRDGLPPVALLDDIEKQLNLHVVAQNWPIGMGRAFKGVVSLPQREVSLFTPQEHGGVLSQVQQVPLTTFQETLSPPEHRALEEDLELITEVGTAWEEKAFREGHLSPVFWGSAMQNFGIEALLQFLCQLAPPPCPRQTLDGHWISPEDLAFNGFVFKIQANMNPKHRDRMAFVRIVSGQFSRGMEVTNTRTGKNVKLSKPHSFLAQERTLLEEAYPGDIIGLYDPGILRIGDTLSTAKDNPQFAGIPRFAPEFFAMLECAEPLKRKALDLGIQQLALEGVIQPFYSTSSQTQPILGAVGALQFEVLQERLKNEYSVKTNLRMLSYHVARWVEPNPEALQWLQSRRDYPIVYDRNQRPVLLAESVWSLQYALQNAPQLQLHEVEPL